MFSHIRAPPRARAQTQTHTHTHIRRYVYVYMKYALCNRMKNDGASTVGIGMHAYCILKEHDGRRYVASKCSCSLCTDGGGGERQMQITINYICEMRN